MKIKRMDATFSTEKLEESKEFYLKYFDFRLAFECDWYVELVTPGGEVGVSFTRAEREEGEFFNGRGVVLSFEVADADAEYERIKRAGLNIYQELQDKPWGERSFVVNDPNGAHVYVYSPCKRTEEYEALYASFQK